MLFSLLLLFPCISKITFIDILIVFLWCGVAKLDVWVQSSTIMEFCILTFLWWCVGLEDGEKILKCGKRKRRDDVHWVWGNCEKMREDAKIAKIHGESCWLLLWPLFRCLYFVRYFFKKSCLMTSRTASIFLLGYWVGDRGAISNSHLPQLRFTSWCLSALEDHLHVSSPGIATKTEKRPTQVLA